jgi:hypothetical protein
MDETAFWALIELAKAEMTARQFDQPEILQKKLERLPPAEILEFDRIFTKLHRDAYRWDLWAAAYIIEGGCGEDGFTDFRAGLIGLGREVYDAALQDPKSLVRQPARGVDFSQEELLYAASSAYEVVTGAPMPEHALRHPTDPLGQPWEPARLAETYPELAKKFGFRRV